MLLIYTPNTTPRLQYVMQLFLGELIKTEFQITSDAQQFQNYAGAKLNYSKQQFSDECFVFAEDLLFEAEIHQQKISIGVWKGIKTLFAHQQSSDLPFDPFAAAFYLVSRYEEYLPCTPDEYGRFPDTQNIGVREGFHEIPVVNHYGLFVKELLQQEFPNLLFKNSAYQYQLTYDIDFAFAYRGKGIVRNAGGYAKSFLKLDWKEISSRTKVLLRNQSDPYDTFDFQFSLHEKLNLQPIYFFLLGDYRKFDKNISWKNHQLQSLIRKVSGKYEVGIHSSFASNDHSEKLKIEVDRLTQITRKNITRNRQHFLKLKFPSTYRTLLANGITEDYTMGFASQVGFRAGIASSVLWYDLSKEETTSLRIFPFAVMDATLYYYQKLSAEQAFFKTKKLIDEVKKVNGYFQFLAHNDLLSEKFLWSGWREKFEEVNAYACRK